MSKQNILKDADLGTRIYNSDQDIFYIKTKKGWQRDDNIFSQINRNLKQSSAEEGVRPKLNFRGGAPTIGSDGSYSTTEKGFVITDKSNPELADTLRKSEKARVNVRDKLKIEKAKGSNERLYKDTNKWIDDEVTFLQKKYPNVTRDLLEQAYKSKDPAKFLSERNLTIGRKDKGHVNASIFTQMKSLENLEKTLNINQPEKVPPNETTGPGSSFDVSQKNQNKGRIVSDTDEPSNKVSLEPGKKYAMANTSKPNNNSNEVKPNDKVQQHRFSWEKDLNPKEAKKLDNIRKVFGDYRNELNINKKTKGSEANRKKLTGPMNQHTAEMLGLL